MTSSLGVKSFSEDDVNALLEFIDTDNEWKAFHEFLENHPDSEMGYKCHVVSLKDIERELYPKGYTTLRQREKVIHALVKEIWSYMRPKGEPVQKPIFNEGNFTGEFDIEYVPVLPKNLFIDGSINNKECKQIIQELKDKAHSKYIMCYYTCFIFDEKTKNNQAKNVQFHYDEPTNECRLNAKYYINSNGIVQFETYNELDLL